PAGAGEARALYRRQPDGAAADDHDRVAISDLRDVERGADPGHHATAEKAGAVERQFLRHNDRLMIGDDRAFAKAADEHQLLQFASIGEAGSALPVESDPPPPALARR